MGDVFGGGFNADLLDLIDSSGFAQTANNLSDLAAAATARTNLGLGTAATTAATDYAVAAKGVTNGDSHDHSGGDGAQIDHTTLSNIGTNAHSVVDTHLASAANPHTVTATQVGLGSVENTALSTWAGTSSITTVGTLSAGDATAIVSAASDSAAGKAELATAAETTTGTDAGRVVTPDGLAGSDYGKRTISVLVNDSTALTSGDGKAYFPRIPSTMNGWNVVEVAANMVAGTGAVTIMIHNLTDAQDILSVALTIDANEKDSKDAATPATINTSYDDVATGDRFRVDIDGAGTGTTWLDVQMTLQAP